jgi:ssDNA-binding Zn-finger/Zn-ribbon topoisomerase 1
MNDQKKIEDGVIDKLEEVVDKARKELMTVQCPEHGQALKKLDFKRDEGRFQIETCCENGEKLVNAEIQKLG